MVLVTMHNSMTSQKNIITKEIVLEKVKITAANKKTK